MAGERKVAFTEDAARRVAAATLAYERGSRDMPPIKFRTAGGDDGTPIRLCKTTALWQRDTVATLNVWETGTTPSESQSTGETIAATNKMHAVPSGTFVHVAQASNGVWYLVESGNGECQDQMPAIRLDEQADGSTGTDAISQGTGVELLLNENGCARWWRLDRQQVVVDVRWENGLVVEKRYVWVVRDTDDSTEATIIEATTCEAPP